LGVYLMAYDPDPLDFANQPLINVIIGTITLGLLFIILSPFIIVGKLLK
jgi:hypothetical protein